MENFVKKAIFLVLFSAFAISGYSQVCPAAPGDPTVYGNNAWIGYAYQAADNFDPLNYMGYFNEPVTFNESFCGNDCFFTINGCSVRTEQFSVRFKMTLPMVCGDYVFTIGGDDGVRLSVDGVEVANDYTDHGYRTISSAPVTLSESNHNLILDFYERGGGNQVSFSYAFATGSTHGPGVIAASQVLCQAAPFDPVAFTSTTDASFCTGTGPTYQWQQSTDQTTWSDIPGATSNTYDVPSYSTLGTIYYRRSANNGTLTI